MSDIPREFVFTRYPARQGLVWLATAYTMFKGHRIGWVLLVIAYFFALLLVSVVPYIGLYMMIVMKPVLAVGLLAAAWTQERGGKPAIAQLLQGFRANLWSLLAIGLFLFAGIVVAVLASSLVDGGKLLELAASGRSMSEAQLTAALSDSQLKLGMAFSTLLTLPVVIATWWAPALVVFQDARPGAALAASVRAALANWKTLAVYGLLLFFYTGVVPRLIYGIVSVIVAPPAGELLVSTLLLPYWLFLAATLHISDYVSYRDVFHASETLAPLTPGVR